MKKKAEVATNPQPKAEEPEVAYGNKRITFYNSFEEAEEADYKWLASLSPEQHLANAHKLIKSVYKEQLKKNKLPPKGERIIYFD
jgi:hypothetical protein